MPNIRYSHHSFLARKISERLSSKLEKEYTQSHQNFDKTKSYDLLLLDRRDDPITPLILNWSYLAMVDELIGIEDNQIKQNAFGNTNAQVFQRASGDELLDVVWDLNFGEAGNELSLRLDGEKKNRNIDLANSNLEDLSEIMSKMPEMKKKLNDLSKHSDIFKYLNQELTRKNLFKLSGIQQDISTENKKTE